jgi:hypothetical protein
VNGPWWAVALFWIIVTLAFVALGMWWRKHGDVLLLKIILGAVGMLALMMLLLMLGNLAFAGEFQLPEGPDSYT